MLISGKRPSDLMMEKAWEWNNDYGGLAWRENGFVHWKKGISSYTEMRKLINTLSPPFVAHFRRASCGGLDAALNHPFPITEDVDLSLEGKTKESVLFHNGDWKEWDRYALNAATTLIDGKKINIPKGRWNDSRALAWMMSIYGIGFLDLLIEQRGVVFSPTETIVFLGFPNKWKEVEDIWCSNDVFMEKAKGKSNLDRVCAFGNCRSVQGLDAEGYCPEHRGGKTVYMREREKLGLGGSQPKHPFPKISEGQIISLDLAEKLHHMKNAAGDRAISKNLIKKIRALYGEIGSKGSRAEKAAIRMASITKELSAKTILSGPVT